MPTARSTMLVAIGVLGGLTAACQAGEQLGAPRAMLETAEAAPGQRCRGLSHCTLAFTVQPSNTAAGATIAPAVQVTVRDPLGNTATGFSGNVNLAIATGPVGAKLSGTRTVTAVAGVASFADLSCSICSEPSVEDCKCGMMNAECGIPGGEVEHPLEPDGSIPRSAFASACRPGRRGRRRTVEDGGGRWRLVEVQRRPTLRRSPRYGASASLSAATIASPTRRRVDSGGSRQRCPLADRNCQVATGGSESEQCPNQQVSAHRRFRSLHLCDSGLAGAERPGQRRLRESSLPPSRTQLPGQRDLQLHIRGLGRGQPQEVRHAPDPPTRRLQPFPLAPVHAHPAPATS